MKNALVSALATIVVPGIAVVLVPYWILLATGRLWGPRIGVLEAFAVGLALLGAVMVVWVSVAFVTRGKGTPVPVAPPEVLVAEGLYRFVRNPMYVGALLVLVAEAILFRSAWILLYAGFLWLGCTRSRSCSKSRTSSAGSTIRITSTRSARRAGSRVGRSERGETSGRQGSTCRVPGMMPRSQSPRLRDDVEMKRTPFAGSSS